MPTAILKRLAAIPATELARQAGFAPLEAGPLSTARLLEPIGEFNIHMGFFLGHGTLVAPIWIDTKTPHYGA